VAGVKGLAWWYPAQPQGSGSRSRSRATSLSCSRWSPEGQTALVIALTQLLSVPGMMMIIAGQHVALHNPTPPPHYIG